MRQTAGIGERYRFVNMLEYRSEVDVREVRWPDSPQHKRTTRQRNNPEAGCLSSSSFVSLHYRVHPIGVPFALPVCLRTATSVYAFAPRAQPTLDMLVGTFHGPSGCGPCREFAVAGVSALGAAPLDERSEPQLGHRADCIR